MRRHVLTTWQSFPMRAPITAASRSATDCRDCCVYCGVQRITCGAFSQDSPRLPSRGAAALNSAVPVQLQRPPALGQELPGHAAALQLDPEAAACATQDAGSPSQWPLATGAERAAAAARRGNARALARGPRPTVQVTLVATVAAT